jgi:hypothetical protein
VNRLALLVRRYGDGTGIVETPAARARLLAAYLESTADLMESGAACPAGVEKTAEQIEAAFRAFIQIPDERQARLRLVQAIADAAELEADVHTYLAPEVLAALRTGATTEAARVRASIAREQYAFFFPALAMKLERELLAKAVTAWKQEAGRPPKAASGGSKWDIMNDLGMSIGIPDVSPDTIQREWRRFSSQNRTGKGGVKVPSI